MSFFTDIENAEHSTVAWIEKELTAIEKKAPTIERVVDASISYIAPALQIGLTAAGLGPEAALVAPIVAQAQSDLQVGSALVSDFGATPTAASIFTSVKTNLSALLSATDVKSPVTVAAVTKAVNEVGLLGTAIATAATQVKAAASPNPAPAPVGPEPVEPGVSVQHPATV